MQLKGWRLHLWWRLRASSWCNIVIHFRNSESKRLVSWVLELWLVWRECYYCIMQSLEKGHPCVFQINFCLWMLLNGTLPSKYFQGGGKRMLSSYLLNIYQASFSAGKIFKMKDQQISSFFTVHHNGIFFFFKKMMHLVLEVWIPMLFLEGNLAFITLWTVCTFWSSNSISRNPYCRSPGKPKFLSKWPDNRDWLSYAMLTRSHYKWEKAGYKMIPFSTVWCNPIINVLFAISKYSTVNI